MGRQERVKAQEAFRHDPEVQVLLATDAADTLAATGIPFREAHEIVGRQGSVSTSSVEAVLAKKNVVGGSAPDRVRAAAQAALESLE